MAPDNLSDGYLADRREARTERRRPRKLTQKEKNVLWGISHGLRYKEIGKVMHVAPETVRVHALSAREKLLAATPCHAACQALRDGLID